MVKVGVCFLQHGSKLLNIINYAKFAEESGFEYVWIPDDDLCYDTYVTLTAIALSSSRVKIGSSVSNPYSRNPALLASTIATIDELSNGRAILGIGAGGSLTLRPLGIPMWNKPLTAIKEAITIIRKLLRNETLNFNGNFFKLVNAKLPFSPFRPNIPIYVAARGPKLLRLAGELADGAILGGLPLSYMDYAIEYIKNGINKAKKSIKEFDIAVAITFAMAESDEKAKSFISQNVAYIIADTPDYVLEKAFMDEKILKTIKSIKNRLELKKANSLIPIEVARLFTIFGTRKSCIELIEKLLEKNIKQLIFVLPYSIAEDMLNKIKNEILPNL